MLNTFFKSEFRKERGKLNFTVEVITPGAKNNQISIYPAIPLLDCFPNQEQAPNRYVYRELCFHCNIQMYYFHPCILKWHNPARAATDL